MGNEKVIPTGVKIIAVLNYIGAVLLALLALIFLISAGAFAGILNEIFPLLGVLGGAIFIFVSIFLLGFAVLLFFIGRGLWKGQKWARIIEIFFAGLGLLTALTGIFSGEIIDIFYLVFHGLIGGYLLFNAKVKEAFA